MQSDTTVVSITAVFFKKAAIIIAIPGQKTLYWQLNKVIPSGMSNHNFEAINSALNKRIKNQKWNMGHYIHNYNPSDALDKV